MNDDLMTREQDKFVTVDGVALRYIEDPQRSLSDIAFELGFSQPSAFTRAFRRWAKVSPTEYRAGHLRRARA